MKKILENKETIICSFILATLPILLCVIRTAIDAKTIGDVWLGASTWNDEAFYYKQVEGMVSYGIPQGYFGYNESSAEYLTFGAWNPLLLLPWAIWGWIFGWNMFSSIICNIAFFSASLLFFGLIIKINKRQLIVLAILLALFTPISRYLLSSMPEVIIISLLIMVAGLFLSAEKTYTYSKMGVMYFLLVYLVTIRPYLAVFMALPLVIEFKKKKGKILITVGATLLALVLYSIIIKKFTCAYFGDIYTNWMGKVQTHGVRVVLSEMTNSLRFSVVNLYYNIGQAIKGNNATGAYFAVYLVMLIGWIVCSINSFIKKNAEEFAFNLLMVLGRIFVLLAILIMYNLADGSKHLITFIVVDLFLLLFNTKINIPVYTLLSILFFAFFIFKIDNEENYAIPYKSDAESQIEATRESLEKLVILGDSYWENTAIYLYDNYDDDNNAIVTKWQYMYAMPAGFGINYCSYDYLTNSIDNLKGRIVITAAENAYNNVLVARGWNEIYHNDDIVVFEGKLR